MTALGEAVILGSAFGGRLSTPASHGSAPIFVIPGRDKVAKPEPMNASV